MPGRALRATGIGIGSTPLDRPSHPGFRLGRGGHPASVHLRPLRASRLHVSGVTTGTKGGGHPWTSGFERLLRRSRPQLLRAARKGIQRIAQRAVPALADFAVVFIVAGRTIVGIASAQCDASRARLLRDLQRVYRIREGRSSQHRGAGHPDRARRRCGGISLHESTSRSPRAGA